jgi:transcriptional regulator with XRE-family HTH domain
MINEEVLNEARKMISGFMANRRNELGISQAKLAELTGMGIATIKRLESGKFWINLRQYLILCHHLECYPFLAEKEKDTEWTKIMRERWGPINKN